MKIARVVFVFMVSTVLFCGCAPYQVNMGLKAPLDKGYVVTRDGVVLPEYTIGENGLPPDDIGLARERFKRRRKTVEDYYKKIGYIENRFKENVPDRLGYMWGIVRSVFTLPVRTVNSYKYGYDPEYRDKIDAIQAEKEKAQKEHIDLVRAELKEYIRKDLEEEKGRLNKS